MVSLRLSPKFEKAFDDLDDRLKKRADKSIELFMERPRHPSLHFEKLSGSPYRTIRVEMKFRIVLRELGPDEFELVDIGHHDYVDRAYG
ncbi:type II toxin-antitoxin system RelE/ParE family toxin [Chelatococcus asaccharovorans]|uniref:type II toxin-antitoxin system RelE/ParE family toxin n=1 Tax=Chelatococcus asaccharovorans TaxID=28210 RepID=UPI00224C6C3D|nr:conserved hypothetical protein [Chelatococcus asaccharovorans]